LHLEGLRPRLREVLLHILWFCRGVQGHFLDELDLDLIERHKPSELIIDSVDLRDHPHFLGGIEPISTNLNSTSYAGIRVSA
jgi:hypothetical protein